MDPTADPTSAQLRLQELQLGTDAGTALAFFDSLPPVQVPELFGSWRGSEVPTGHRLDGLLEPLGWYGKRFDGAEEVFPLVVSGAGGGVFNVNPALVPLAAVLRFGPLLRKPGLQAAVHPALRLARTRRPGARLRMTEYRGVLSAAMIYDALPVLDVFRRVDDGTVLGAMDLRGPGAPFFFALHRG
ncbi:MULTISPECIES: DUF4334 domain-containing protein [unclassified Arthrobacter]|uniref:DUF4334 domain-containing protein n=1 Tax=unclassified Arthrobacter TaxID=235627 RepID=UPI001E463203|nr:MULTISPECIES: DUF4334 domain-containing protein [unclassified Arthrobacter]MCC9145256.1 DUF4334 domain-containing protein [Arthrobacter sp. zg-Y919]MDK1276484.1 DUF4334 domain-containing protein [Arthrobacter sp. zg.Y919]WIB01918.1 DUF4334 domain-containing protein [Arthrobacter sp. zg-Y919]